MELTTQLYEDIVETVTHLSINLYGLRTQEIEDSISTGLMRALDKFNEKGKTPFKTFAVPVILRHVYKDFVRNAQKQERIQDAGTLKAKGLQQDKKSADNIETVELTSAIRDYLKKLKKNYGDVIWDYINGYSARETGERHGYTKEMVYHIKRTHLPDLRRHLRVLGLGLGDG